MYKINYLELTKHLSQIGVSHLDYLYGCGFNNPYKIHERLLTRDTVNEWSKSQLEKGLITLDINPTPYFECVDNSYFLGKI